MRLQLSVWFIIGFLAAALIFSQLHEMTHIVVGRLICGGWGEQADFNVWALCCDCLQHNPYAFLASLAGPLFSYVMMYYGASLLSSSSYFRQLMGIVFIFGNKPFARIFTALAGGGDEITALKLLFGDHIPLIWTKLIGFMIVFLIVFPPLLMVYRKMQHKNKLLLFSAFCIIPLLFQWLYEFKFLNNLLRLNFLPGQHFMGIADLIHIHTIVMIIVWTISLRSMGKQVKNKPVLKLKKAII